MNSATKKILLFTICFLTTVQLMLANVMITEIVRIDETCGLNNGQLTVLASSDNSNAVLQYSIDAGSTFQMENTFENLSSGDYLIIVSDGSNCTDVFTAQISDINFENLALNSSGGLCSGSIALSISLMDATGLQWYADGEVLDGETGTELMIAQPQQGTTYTISGVTSTGCSITTNGYTVEQDQLMVNISEELCIGDTLVVSGFPIITQPGEYPIVSNLSSGCDSITVLTVVECQVFDPSAGPTEFSAITGGICRGLTLYLQYQGVSDFQWYKDGELLPGETSDYISLHSIVGDDVLGEYHCEFTFEGNVYQTVSYDINEIPSYYTDRGEELICEGDTVTFNEFMLTTSGTFQYQTTAVDGCDSIVSLDVVVLQNTFEFLDEELCEGDTLDLAILPVDFPPIVSSGEYEIVTENADGCDHVTRLTVTMIQCQSSTIAMNGFTSAVKLMPNPTSGHVNIRSESPIKNIAILDFDGRVLMNEFLYNSKSEVVLDLEQMDSGLYLIQVNTEEGKTVEKLILD